METPPAYHAVASPREAIPQPGSSLQGHQAAAPPSDAQRCRAPLLINRSNRRISENYVLEVHGVGYTEETDLQVKTTNGGIDVSIWLEGLPEKKRPISLDVGTTNATIRCSIHKMEDDQIVQARVDSTNGPLYLSLPRTFKGILTMKTTNSGFEISPSLKPKSVQISNPDASDKLTYTFEINGGGPDTAECRTTNSGIKVGTEGEQATKVENNNCIVL